MRVFVKSRGITEHHLELTCFQQIVLLLDNLGRHVQEKRQKSCSCDQNPKV